MPTRYQASVVISITEREQWIQVYQRNLVRIAKSEDLIDSTFAEAGISDPEQRSSIVFALSLEYWGLMQLHVRAEDPVLAAKAANTWANLVYERMKEVYGTDQESLNLLQEQVATAEESWLAAQEALNEYQLDYQPEIYTAQLTAAQSALSEVLLEQERTQLLLSDAYTLQAQIEGMGSDETLSIGAALSLANLLARSTIVEQGSGLQIQEDQIKDTDLSAAEAGTILGQFISAVETQNEQMIADGIALEEEISELAVRKENKQAQLQQLTVKQDLAESEYMKFSNQLDDFITEQRRVDSAVAISNKALPPTESINPNILGISVIAGLSAALLTILVKGLFDWWIGRE
jgi:capsular polysaccharide biosynthesis protein